LGRQYARRQKHLRLSSVRIGTSLCPKLEASRSVTNV
jgi:hypothetical protein